jgi:hypothetical protein
MREFLRRKLVDHIGAPRPPLVTVNIDLPLVDLTPEELKEADESIKFLQQEDR